jgi:hypothetical protein
MGGETDDESEYPRMLVETYLPPSSRIDAIDDGGVASIGPD